MVTVFVRCKNSRILEKKLRHIQSTTKNNFLSAEYYRESSTAPNQSTRCGSEHYPNLKSKNIKLKTYMKIAPTNICQKKIGSLVSVWHKK